MRKSHAITIRIERQFIAFTGLSQRAFERLLIEFTPGLEEARQHRHQIQGRVLDMDMNSHNSIII